MLAQDLNLQCGMFRFLGTFDNFEEKSNIEIYA